RVAGLDRDVTGADDRGIGDVGIDGVVNLVDRQRPTQGQQLGAGAADRQVDDVGPLVGRHLDRGPADLYARDAGRHSIADVVGRKRRTDRGAADGNGDAAG